jgi:hypothetical protein
VKIQHGYPVASLHTGSIIYAATGGGTITGVLYEYHPETGQGMMISAAGTKTQWGAYGQEIPNLPVTPDRNSAGTDFSGFAHSDILLAALDDQCIDFSGEPTVLNGNYAAYWCDTLAAGGYTDWYLPAPGELKKVYDAGIKNLLQSIGKNPDDPYWTASHAGTALAWAFCFGNGYFHPALKYRKYEVSAVRPFTVPEVPDGIYAAGGGAFLLANGMLENCIVEDNTSSSYGGGVYAGTGSQLLNCRVEGNNAPEGKEIYYEHPIGISAPDKASETLSVFPNPVVSGGKITVNGISGFPISYQLIHSTGAMIRSGRLAGYETELPAPEQPGVYVLQMQSGNGTYRAKIIVR